MILVRRGGCRRKRDNVTDLSLWGTEVGLGQGGWSRFGRRRKGRPPSGGLGRDGAGTLESGLRMEIWAF
jgi:hypothetical protein